MRNIVPRIGNPIPKTTAYKIFRVSDGKLVFAGNRKDAQKELKKLGGTRAGYRFFLTLSETMPKNPRINPWVDVAIQPHIARAAEIALVNNQNILLIGHNRRIGPIAEHLRKMGLKVWALQPCLCGYYLDPTTPCTCSVSQVQKQQAKIAKIPADIKLEVPTVEHERLLDYALGKYRHEPESKVLERVNKAKKFVLENGSKIHPDAQSLLKAAIRQLNIASTTEIDSIIKSSIASAKLEGSDMIKAHHLAEALQYYPRSTTNPVTKKNTVPRKETGRVFSGQTFYYAARTIYPTKARSVALELAGQGIRSRITERKDMGYLIWTSKPVYVELVEPFVSSRRYHNPRGQTGTHFTENPLTKKIGSMTYTWITDYVTRLEAQREARRWLRNGFSAKIVLSRRKRAQYPYSLWVSEESRKSNPILPVMGERIVRKVKYPSTEILVSPFPEKMPKVRKVSKYLIAELKKTRIPGLDMPYSKKQDIYKKYGVIV